ncbi:oxygen-independent coproporphyrinogen III oxidase [Pseudoduganella violacea]|uniref:Coproporphyrinogen-III oxidase n=1 Tax=Pseudoduganella violacea TaxID=1715466 RepID=A0A7W5FVE0_9BURK|nr:oxygen-independent coproporphyrinogen III oxidase [Pseudoduganella violacea]MBB3120697.1 oxygen-independent coproporphyrinogen-3 oxidase [Pseudoduganella violacea]
MLNDPSPSRRGVIPLVPQVEFDAALVRRMSKNGPRYTSYPTADRFIPGFGPADYRAAVARSRGGMEHGLSLYVHIPFCASLCYYCGCNKIITQDRTKSVQYLQYLEKETELQAALFAGRNRVEQLHFGGGTPTFLDDEQMSNLLAGLRARFRFAPDEKGEYSIEVDPRTVSALRIHTLRRQGFNRISLGIQDFDPNVQRAVNRVQSERQILHVMRAARSAGFRSISVDLIYGLPLQTVQTMSATLDKVIDANPDRIAVYNYAHLPHLFKSQRLIESSQLPSPEAKLEMLGLCIKKLNEAGYVYIGMDHFAKPEDDLALAQREGRLHRNFQGYSTHANADMVALGVSSISAVGGCYSQNEKTLAAYYNRLDRGELPIARGISLNQEDLLRRDIIGRLMCDFELDFDTVALPEGLSFEQCFASELEQLRQLEEQGLLSVSERSMKVKMRGRLLIRNICMVFDQYLSAVRMEGPAPLRYSTTI